MIAPNKEEGGGWGGRSFIWFGSSGSEVLTSIIGVGDHKWIPFPVMGLVPWNSQTRYFSIISCDKRVHFLRGVAQRINKQHGVRNYLRRRWINSIWVILPSSEFEARPWGNPFDNNSEYEDCACNSDHVNYHSESLFFLTNPVWTEVGDVVQWISRSDKKNSGKRRAESSQQQHQQIMSKS